MSSEDLEEFTTFSVQGYDFSLPNEVMNLLYFADESAVSGPTGIDILMTIDPGSDEFDVVEISPSDPSIIYLDMSINEPADITDVPKPGHFPSYSRLSPEQKWAYLDWLQAPSQPIDIGYVFIYYYGLERHLAEGNFDLAFDEILYLRKHHDHPSFVGYSDPALIYSLVIRNHFERLEDIIYLTGANGWSVAGLLAAYYLNMDLSGGDLIGISRMIKGVNKRYIEMEPELFESVLNEIIRSKYNNDNFPFSDRYEIANVPVRMEAFANYALPKRFYGLPHFCEHQPFADEAKAVLTTTHEEVKSILKERRRKKT